MPNTTKKSRPVNVNLLTAKLAVEQQRLQALTAQKQAVQAKLDDVNTRFENKTALITEIREKITSATAANNVPSN